MEPGRRKMFGPVTYAMLGLLAVCLPIGAALRLVEWMHQPAQTFELDPGAKVDAAIAGLTNPDPQVRDEAVSSLGECLFAANFNPSAAAARERAVAAIRGLLRGTDPMLQAGAAAMLARFSTGATELVGDLVPLLRVDDQTVQVAAASALLRLAPGGEAGAAAYERLAALAADPFAHDRKSVMTALIEAGEPGREIVLGVLPTLVEAPEAAHRAANVGDFGLIAAQLGVEAVARALEGPLESSDVGVRASAAMMVVSAAASAGPPESLRLDPKLAAALEAAALDRSQPCDFRRMALAALAQPDQPFDLRNGPFMSGMPGIFLMGGPGGSASSSTAAAVRRAGLALVHQLDDGDYNVRLTAAMLLQSISPEILAGKPADEAQANPDPAP